MSHIEVVTSIAVEFSDKEKVAKFSAFSTKFLLGFPKIGEFGFVRREGGSGATGLMVLTFGITIPTVNPGGSEDFDAQVHSRCADLEAYTAENYLHRHVVRSYVLPEGYKCPVSHAKED